MQAWALSSDSRHRRVKPGRENPRSAQQDLLETLCGLADDALDANASQDPGLLLQVRLGERVALESIRGKAELGPVHPNTQPQGRQGPGTAAAVEPGRESKQDAELERQRRA